MNINEHESGKDRAVVAVQASRRTMR